MNKAIWHLAAAVVLVAMVVTLASAQEAPGKAEPQKPAERPADRDNEVDKEAKADEKKQDEFVLYRKKGRKWVHRNTITEGDQTRVTYSEYEVVDVAEQKATVRLRTLNQDRDAIGEPFEYAVEFRARRDATPTEDEKKEEPKTETIRVEAGSYECLLEETEFGQTKRKRWIMKKFPQLIVKEETEREGNRTVTELVEFKE
jgi:hypothetical protein